MERPEATKPEGGHVSVKKPLLRRLAPHQIGVTRAPCAVEQADKPEYNFDDSPILGFQHRHRKPRRRGISQRRHPRDRGGPINWAARRELCGDELDHCWLGSGQALALCLGKQRFLAGEHLVPQRDEIDISLAALCKHAFRGHLFLPHMMLDLF